MRCGRSTSSPAAGRGGWSGRRCCRRWLVEESASLPEWLVEETHAAVGDLAETIALLVSHAPGARLAGGRHAPAGSPSGSSSGCCRCAAWTRAQRAAITGWWRGLPYRESFLVNKLLTGALRVGVSQTLVTRALAEALAVPRTHVEHTLMGDWTPTAGFWTRLATPDGERTDPSQPYPFYLACHSKQDPARSARAAQWLAEWKWDGIRGQLMRRAGQTFAVVARRGAGHRALSRARRSAAASLPDGTVLDGEVLAWRDGAAAAVRAAAAAHRAQDADREGRWRMPGAFPRLRPAGARRRGPARPSAAERRALLAELRGAPGDPRAAPAPVVESADWEALASRRASAQAAASRG